jgi:hypothetical protein
MIVSNKSDVFVFQTTMSTTLGVTKASIVEWFKRQRLEAEQAREILRIRALETKRIVDKINSSNNFNYSLFDLE